MKIFVGELECFKNLSKEEKDRARVRAGTAFKIPEELSGKVREQLKSYITWRGEKVSLGTMRSDLWRFHAFSRFLTDRHKDLSSLAALPLEDLKKSLKIWMVKNGYALSGIHNRLNMDSAEIKTSPLILYLEAVYAFAKGQEDIPETEKDIWEISKLGFETRDNPVHRTKTINFAPITQDGLRAEAKKAALVTLRYLAVPTVSLQLRGLKRLSAFLSSRYPAITCAGELDRDVIEDYLTFLNTEVTGKRSFRSELAGLKNLLDTIALVTETPGIRELFLPGDCSDRGRIAGYKAYTDKEIKIWNEAVLTLPSQIARALIIHELLGNRISETLTLKSDCVVERGGHTKIRVFQQKTGFTVYKPAGEKVLMLIAKALEETRQRFGDREYIFVDEKNPDQPMRYGKVQYHLMKMIRALDLRDENGKRFGVGTHAFRHTMGQKLTQLHYDDETIAQLLGHTGTGSVDRYRRFGSKKLAQETRALREKQDDIILRITKEWDGDEI